MVSGAYYVLQSWVQKLWSGILVGNAGFEAKSGKDLLVK